MATTEKEDIAFYRNGSAQKVLERFDFSEEEVELINSAIRTANMTHPRMKIIHESNALLKEVAKTREPILATSNDTILTEANVKMSTMRLSQEQHNMKIGTSRLFDMPQTKIGRIAFFIFVSGLLSVFYYVVQVRESYNVG